MPTLVVVVSPGTLMHQDPPFKAPLLSAAAGQHMPFFLTSASPKCSESVLEQISGCQARIRALLASLTCSGIVLVSVRLRLGGT